MVHGLGGVFGFIEYLAIVLSLDLNSESKGSDLAFCASLSLNVVDVLLGFFDVAEAHVALATVVQLSVSREIVRKETV